MDGFAVHAPRFREATTILRDGDHIATCREKKGEGDWAAWQCKADCSSVAQVFNSSLMLGARPLFPGVPAGPTQPRIFQLRPAWAYGFQEGSLLTVRITEGAVCVDLAAGWHLAKTYQITGGAGRFKGCATALGIPDR